MSTRLHFGIPGVLGALIFVAWFVGWIFLDLRDGPYHILAAVGAFLMLVQVVRRVAAN
jgi:hypothetical protein